MMAAIWASAILLASALAAAGADAPTCRKQQFDGQGYVVCQVRAGDDLRLFLTAADGKPLGTFERLRADLAARGETLVFAMNAGMFHPDRSPVGLYVEEGTERSAIVTSAGPGNFGLLPNGVLCLGKDGFAVMESRSFAGRRPECRFATQSGPMLVIGGRLHPRLLPTSDNRNIRNGVGVAADGKTAWFAISDAPVTFFEFARLFRDGLGTPDALFLDGSVSRLFAPEVGRDDFGLPMGPMVGLVAGPDASGG